jgi:hypothetical protein
VGARYASSSGGRVASEPGGHTSHPNTDRGITSTNHISVLAALDRGHVVIPHRGFVIMGFLLATGVALTIFFGRPIAGVGLVVFALFVASLRWSHATPRWRRLALSRGASAVELQRVVERERLVWPTGHLLERTEFRARGDLPPTTRLLPRRRRLVRRAGVSCEV